jgi:hypothetical protein
VRLISDPWLVGTVFHDGWALTARTVMTFDDFKDITHIWFSHEHPDHFFPDNLKRIPEAYRRRIQVLYQETRDKKVVRFCQKLGFGSVTELRPRTWIPLGEGVQVLNCPNDTNWLADSWLCARTPGRTLLNLNDCGAHGQLEAIKELVGEVDVLATQFSFAQWVKNAEAVDHRRAHERRVLQDVKAQIDVLKPKYVIPFASFVWFCTEDNFYLNAEKNTITDVCTFVRENTAAGPIAMYPGDRWTVGEPHDSSAAISRFERDARQIADPALRPRTRRDVVDAKALIEAGQGYRRRLVAVSNRSSSGCISPGSATGKSCGLRNRTPGESPEARSSPRRTRTTLSSPTSVSVYLRSGSWAAAGRHPARCLRHDAVVRIARLLFQVRLGWRNGLRERMFSGRTTTERRGGDGLPEPVLQVLQPRSGALTSWLRAQLGE